jgi:hypothetical protein
MIQDVQVVVCAQLTLCSSLVNFKGVVVLRVVFPNGYYKHFSVYDTIAGTVLPNGFNAVSLNITEIDESTRNFFLTLSIVNASFLEGGKIKCDDTTPRNVAEAGCPFASMLFHYH